MFNQYNYLIFTTQLTIVDNEEVSKKELFL